MGLDVYVGTLTRYFAGDWELIAQTARREMSIDVVVDRPPATPAITDRHAVQAQVEDWRRVTARSLGTTLDWDEGDDRPYFTDRPDWDGYFGLLFLAAHVDRPSIDPPMTWPDDPTEHRLLRAVAEGTSGGRFRRRQVTRPGGRYGAIILPSLWLPVDRGYAWKGEFPNGEILLIASVDDLSDQLHQLVCDLGADRATLAAWESLQGPPTDASLGVNGHECARHEALPPLDAGRRALPMFLRLVALAVEHRLPIRLDY